MANSIVGTAGSLARHTGVRAFGIALTGAGLGELVYGRRETHLPVLIAGGAAGGVSAAATARELLRTHYGHPTGSWNAFAKRAGIGLALGAVAADMLGDTFGGGSAWWKKPHGQEPTAPCPPGTPA